MDYEIRITVLKSFPIIEKNLKTKQVVIKTTRTKYDIKTK
jgi:hypothetical protein